MESMFTATLGAKGQITLPKVVRQLLGIGRSGEIVGFMVNNKAKSVKLKKLKVVLDEEDFSEQEYQKLLGLPKKKGGKHYSSMQNLLKDIQKE